MGELSFSRDSEPPRRRAEAAWSALRWLAPLPFALAWSVSAVTLDAALAPLPAVQELQFEQSAPQPAATPPPPPPAPHDDPFCDTTELISV